jgi:hypothetical protein
MVTAAEKKATRVSRWFEGAGIKLNSCCKIGGVPDDSAASDSLGIFATQPLERYFLIADFYAHILIRQFLHVSIPSYNCERALYSIFL